MLNDVKIDIDNYEEVEFENNSRIYPSKNVKSILDINSSEINIVVTLGNESDEVASSNVPTVLSQLDSFEILNM